MKTKGLISLIFCVLISFGFAQKLNEKEIKKFEAAENILKTYTEEFKYDSLDFKVRVENIHEFIPKFVAILKEKNSFQYSFDSLQGIMKVYAPDSSFRIFTWQLREPLGTHRYYGALQLNTQNLSLFPLFDFSDTMTVHPQEILNKDNWYGAIYYKCLLNTIEGENYYTLFAYDDADFVSNRKFLEFLSFNENNEPIFGAPLISITDSNNVTTTFNRFFLEYTDKASVKLNYDTDKNIIIFDHLVPPSEHEKDAYFTYVPDGTYEGFEWKNNKWTWIDKIFHYSINKNDAPPKPHPILDNRD